ncbi:MAG: hypothetical protein RLZZ385_1171 [Pseudomonadota bacterium]|jgi:membrane-bound PQQ-dependent dehydrogenase (glucose/quinate/shikimate family)
MSDSVRRPLIFPLLLLVFAVPLTLGGLRLLLLGGSFYYLAAGLALAASAWLLRQGNRLGARLYGAMLVLTVLWSLGEAGLDAWALAPRILPFAVLGCWLLTPWSRRGLSGQPVPATMAPSVMIGVIWGFILIPLAAVFGNADYHVQSMAPRSGMTAVNTRGDWPSYGNTLGGTRYSPLRQVTPDNVANLQVAWTYRTRAGGAFKATPLQVGDLLYVCTGGNIVIALNAESGELAWQFDPKVPPEQLEFARYFSTGCRGVSYYQAPPDYQGECQARILMATADARMLALDALSGERCLQFGDQGEIDLTQHMGNDPSIFNFQTSPPGIVRGNAVIGGWVLDNRSVGEPSGVIRAFNAVTGRFVWAWDMGRPGNHDEPLRGEVYTRGTPNVWSLFSVDEDLGLIYAPTGNETPDYFGGQRMEVSDRYASSIVAIDGETGEPRWSFQTTHHDIWDYDVPSQPVLIDLPARDGEIIPALLAPTKRSEVFVLNRVTGEPIFDVQELPVPQTGGVPEDYLSPTQPFAMDLPHFRPDIKEADMWGITPIDQMLCRIEYRKMRYEGHFTPPGADTILTFPGPAGGHNWGSVSVDEANHLMVVNPLIMANQLTLIPRDQLPEGVAGSQQGTPYAHTTVRFVSPLEIPCQEPPYGVLAVIDLETKELLWKRPIGTARESGPLGIKTRLPLTVGTPLSGGTVTTAGGLIFIAGTYDNTVRAIDLYSGRELWQNPLPFTAQGTPAVYAAPRSGKQTLVVTVPVYNSTQAVGERVLPAAEEDPLGGYIIAYRLPD